ncbi:MAG: marine proteobacterial sortase target protein [Burkholderiaceae bacterium]
MSSLPCPETPALRMATMSHWRPWLALLLRAIGYALAIGGGLFVLVAVAAGAAQAQTQTPMAAPPSPPSATMTEAGPTADAFDGAALLFRTEQGLIAAPLQSSRVQLRIAGNAVRARIVQRFENPGSEWRNAVYQFPLPEDAAVDTLSLRIGERLITGEIREKQAARRSYEQARDAGQRAAMVSQHRPNMFTAEVANIGPGDAIEIVVEYQQALGLSDTGWTLRLPTVIAPRYEAQQPLPLAEQPSLPQPSLPQPPTIIDRDPRVNRMMVEVGLMPGMPITRPQSPSHAITVSEHALPSEGGATVAHGYDIAFTGEALADRDFVLNWRPLPAAEPESTMQLEAHDGRWYGLLGVTPPAAGERTVRQPRELTFVIDTSGSMHGDSIVQAKAALRFGLERLHPSDRFNIIRFNDRHEALFAASRAADDANLARARTFVDALQADGGTEMQPALERALLPAIPAGLLSQVVFITDGAVSDEAALFETVENLLGARRLYTVGIGSSPNSYFMRQAAVSGRGTFTMIDAGHKVEATMARLFRQLGEPVLTGLRLRDERGELVPTRDPLRDLHAGDPILATLRLDARPEALVLEGERDGRPWQREITLVEAREVGVHKLWARAELERLGAAIRRGADDAERRDALRTQATAVALEHGLVSAYTSLVAVDRTPVRPADQASTTSSVPRQLPAGWNAASVFGNGRTQMSLAGTATGAWAKMLVGLLLLVIAAAFGAGFLCRAQDLFER